jgi:cytochrome b involved in lipid metabolism
MNKQALAAALAVIVVLGIALFIGSSRENETSNQPVVATSTDGMFAEVQSTSSESTVPEAEAAKTMTATEVAAHNSESDCYTIVGGNAYNLTPWIDRHPGGEKAILGLCGKDGTAQFSKQHGSNAQAQAALKSFFIAEVK